jgi:hypothetical protein
MSKTYQIQLTSDEITEVVTALHQREISIAEAIASAKRQQQSTTVLHQRLAACKSAADTVRLADRTSK